MRTKMMPIDVQGSSSFVAFLSRYVKKESKNESKRVAIEGGEKKNSLK